MKYYKNIELARMYQVSIDTISNWINSSIEGKLKLQLYNSQKRIYIVNSPLNHQILRKLATESRRFKNKRFLKTVKPKDEFYKIYSEKDVINIIRGLELEREIPLKYCFFGNGAELWNNQAENIWSKKPGIVLPNTMKLVNMMTPYLESYFESYHKINIIEIGPGNAIPSKELIKKVYETGKLQKYIAYDISKEMQEFAYKNLISWFGNDFPYQYYQGDITKHAFPELLYELSISKDEDKVCNLILFIGGEIENEADYLRQLCNVAESLGANDLLLLEQGLDSERSKYEFTFYEETAPINDEDLKFRVQVLELLNISPNDYQVERYFSPERSAKLVDIVLKCDYKIQFAINSMESTLTLNKNDHITIWRYNSHTQTEVLEAMAKAGFDVVNLCRTLDGESVAVVGKLKTLDI